MILHGIEAPNIKHANTLSENIMDLLAYIAFNTKPITRKERVNEAKDRIFDGLDKNHKDFIKFILSKYIENGVEELDEEKLPILLNLQYSAISDAEEALGDVEKIRKTFFDFQKALYAVSN